MAPVPITVDYYMVLEVEQNATQELIIRSYKRLALKLHPDRNAKHDATEAFQLLGRAYETLKDESQRRAYDLIYPSIRQRTPFPQTAETPRQPPTSPPQPNTINEAAQIAALQKSRQERSARWWIRKNAFESTIFELQRDIRRLEQAIKNLESIIAAEVAEEAQKNSWGTWILSPLYKKAEESEEEKARKDRERQERRIEKDMKERRLALKKADLKREEGLLARAKKEVDTADLIDDGRIQVLQHRIWAREAKEREEKERVERERLGRLRQQQQEQREKLERERLARLRKLQQEQREQREQREKREREVAEALRKQQAEQRKRHEEEAKKRHKILDDELKHRPKLKAHFNPPTVSTHQAYTSSCSHDGWWPKVQGRKACPECDDIWTYLLQCPGCAMEACPKCQSAIRPRLRRGAARTVPRERPRVRTPSPDCYYDSYF